MTTELEDRIRARAHAIWESEGRPDGAQDRHWSEARAAIEAEENLGATDGLQDTNLTSDLVLQGEGLGEVLANGDLGPSLLAELDGATGSDLGGRVKDPV